MATEWDLVLWTAYLPVAGGYGDGSGAGDGEDGWGGGYNHVRYSHIVPRGT